jgi:hypothetical protein
MRCNVRPSRLALACGFLWRFLPVCGRFSFRRVRLFALRCNASERRFCAVYDHAAINALAAHNDRMSANHINSPFQSKKRLAAASLRVSFYPRFYFVCWFRSRATYILHVWMKSQKLVWCYSDSVCRFAITEIVLIFGYANDLKTVIADIFNR